jgi:hypothetical protein
MARMAPAPLTAKIIIMFGLKKFFTASRAPVSFDDAAAVEEGWIADDVVNEMIWEVDGID